MYVIITDVRFRSFGKLHTRFILFFCELMGLSVIVYSRGAGAFCRTVKHPCNDNTTSIR